MRVRVYGQPVKDRPIRPDIRIKRHTSTMLKTVKYNINRCFVWLETTAGDGLRPPHYSLRPPHPLEYTLTKAVCLSAQNILKYKFHWEKH